MTILSNLTDYVDVSISFNDDGLDLEDTLNAQMEKCQLLEMPLLVHADFLHFALNREAKAAGRKYKLGESVGGS